MTQLRGRLEEQRICRLYLQHRGIRTVWVGKGDTLELDEAAQG